MNPELSLVDSDSHFLILHHLPISEEHINTDLRSAACGFNSYYKYYCVPTDPSFSCLFISMY